MSRGRLLIIDDSSDNARLLEEIFRHEGFETVVRKDSTGGLAEAEGDRYTAVFVDWELPDGSGLELCRRLRAADSRLPILMVTGRTDEVSVARALDAGADDFVSKPVRPSEIVARLEATLHRLERLAAPGPPAVSAPTEAGAVIKIGEIEVELEARLVRAGGEPVALGALEFALLAYLVSNRGVALSRDQILSEVYGIDADIDTGRVDLLVRRLRVKLGRGPARGDQIVAVPGYGYRVDTLTR